VGLLPVAGGNDAVIEKAETIRPGRFGMVAGWADSAEEDLFRFLFNQVNSRQTGPGGKHGNGVGLIADLVIGMINRGQAGENRLFKTKQPGLGMKGHQLETTGRPWRDSVRTVDEIPCGEPCSNNLQSLRNFRVFTATGVVQ